MTCRYRNNSTISRILTKLNSDSTTTTSTSTNPIKVPLRSANTLRSLPSISGFSDYLTSMCNNKQLCFSTMVGDLINSGLSMDSITSIGTDLAEAIACKLGLADLMNLINKALAEIEDLIDLILRYIRAILQAILSVTKTNSYQVFNAKKSLSKPDPVTTKSGGTTIPKVKDADYSINDSYPKSYGEIDDAKNWTKVNTETGHSETVHNSGVQEKIDSSGNTVVGITGTLKTVIDKDALIEVKGNLGLIVGGNFTISVAGNTQIEVTGTQTETVNGDVTETYNASQSTTASGNITLKASTILLN